MKNFAEIAVELPIERTFSYAVPDTLKADASAGKRVLVPFGGRTVTGYILSFHSAPPDGVAGVKPITDVLDAEPLFDAQRLKFFRWLSSYYFAPLGEVLSLSHPPSASIKSLKTVRSNGASGGATGLEGEILATSAKGASLSTLLNRFKGKPVFSAIARLKKAGLLTEEVALRGGRRDRLIDFASIKEGADLSGVRHASQLRVMEFLKENGGSPIVRIVEGAGVSRDAVKRLSEKGVVLMEKRRVHRDPLSSITPRPLPDSPNVEQAAALSEISSALRSGAFSPFLLYGVTGSGKTLVYLKALEEAVRLGKGAIILTPEIGLTSWPAAYLSGLFPGKAAIYHSGLSDGERYDEWSRVRSGEAAVVVGARSALFLPVRDLGLIIVDEEHEGSYKQEDGVKYHARDVAVALARQLGITVVLGSATPSIETFHNALTGRIRLLPLRKRVNDALLPEVELLDMRGRKELISERLNSLVSSTLEEGRQALIFLNRRGFSNFIVCGECGERFECPNCSVTLTMHKKRGVLKCHYCDFDARLPDACPKCSSPNIDTPGTGTEKVEEELSRLFPSARVARMDRDTTVKKGAARKIIEAVEGREVDILVGTQMVSKGHHFPGLTLSGVLSADTSLNIPDFRSAERTFQLITQASGRAGRGAEAGRVVIQTLNPSHYCFKAAEGHDYEAFYREEAAFRAEAAYPPFSRLCLLRLDSLREDEARSAATKLRYAAEKILGRKELGISLLGPAPALIQRVKNRHRFQFLVKGDPARMAEMHAFVKALKACFEALAVKGVTLSIDMDPAMTV